MEKILINTDQNKVAQAVADVDHFISASVELNSYLKKTFDITLTKETALDVISSSGSNLLESYRKDQIKKLDKAGIVGKIKANLIGTVDTDIKEDLEELKDSFFSEGGNRFGPLQTINHLEFNPDGTVTPQESYIQALNEKYSMYVETPEHFELYNAQQQAVQALNNLRAVTGKHLPSARFATSAAFYYTFFEFDVNEQFSDRPLNYKLF